MLEQFTRLDRLDDEFLTVVGDFHTRRKGCVVMELSPEFYLFDLFDQPARRFDAAKREHGPAWWKLRIRPA